MMTGSKVDKMSDTDTKDLRAAIRRLNIVGLIGIALMVGGIGSWAATSELSGAVVLPGSLVSESNIKKVQHPSGGVVAQIVAHDGDHVRAGDLLLRLDETAARANLQVVVGQLDAVRARMARLVAERDEADDMAFPRELSARSSDADVAPLMATERSLFRARRVSRVGQKQLLNKRVTQLDEQIHGLEAQMQSQTAQRELIGRELKGIETLYEKRLVPLTRLTTLQREAARLDGAEGQLVSSVAETQSKIAEAGLQVARLDQDFRAEVMKDLRDAQDKEAELAERSIAARDLLSRIEIRAPTTGVVQQLAVHTVGGVISPGEVAMSVVPDDDALLIEAHLQPRDVDQVRVGQKTFVRLSAFNQRTTPELEGKVAFVSADAAHDAQSNSTYYLVRISLPQTETDRLGSLRLTPGMPAEVFLQTGERTLLSYLFKPISDQLSRMFRER